MSDFAGMEDMLQDFLTEASDLLAGVDNKLVELEKHPEDHDLLNEIFRGFHTIKGGAGFLNANEMVALCHRTENLFDKLRNGELKLNPGIMDVILAATAIVREMFGELSQNRQPSPADPAILASLDAVLSGEAMPALATAAPAPAAPGLSQSILAPSAAVAAEPSNAAEGPDWTGMYHGLLGTAPAPAATAAPAAAPSHPLAGAAADSTTPVGASITPARTAPKTATSPAAVAASKDTSIRVDTARLDQVLNLSGEIGLTKNRLTCIRTAMMQGKIDHDSIKDLDEAVSQLDLLVGDLQNAVMKTRMQPIGRLFQKYPRLARDLARQLGKDVELVLSGEDTEIDKTMIEDLNDPLVHLIRNAVDHGVDSPEERQLAGKSAKSLIHLSAEQIGDHIVIEISDDGRGIRPDVIRGKAMEKGLIDAETANSLDERQSLQLIFLPGFSTKDQISDVSGRGVGMDVVKTNIQRLNGRVDVTSVVGQGTSFRILLPLTLAILPVLMVRLGEQPFAVPLSMVREIIPIRPEDVQRVSGKATMVVREEVLPIRTLASLIGWQQTTVPAFGVLMQTGDSTFIMAIDSFIGQADVVIKSLLDIKPRGIAGATLTGDGAIVLVLDMDELLRMQTQDTQAALFA
ncbi:two-component system, chemotaxis family, sensor kinase CheA [Novimethylophilus kurashikiensis]|uniref:Chemotaxis protein CheA n=1 Tax=Novimethylophilus kurashikiensis TaxID=1825523 RepID=A0A2R5F860_9PROT|nr:chemotaxis protein CheA [Novimethylophilus kurashikiensis]GBG12861.1 two-component system, chemotaxis family, sensor kinase CheA [Novimethylophilus kurashikiensis]